MWVKIYNSALLAKACPLTCVSELTLSVLYSDSGLSCCWVPTLSPIWKTPPSRPGSQVWPAPAYSALEVTPLREGRGRTGFFSLPTWLPASYPVQRSAGVAAPRCLSRTESLWFQGGRGVNSYMAETLLSTLIFWSSVIGGIVLSLLVSCHSNALILPDSPTCYLFTDTHLLCVSRGERWL